MDDAAPLSNILGALAYLVPMAVLPGVVAYFLTRRDFRGWRVALITASCVILMVVGSWLGFIYAFFAFVVAAVAYLVGRRLARPGLALGLAAAILVVGLGCSMLMMKIALDGMG